MLAAIVKNIFPVELVDRLAPISSDSTSIDNVGPYGRLGLGLGLEKKVGR